jgi:hypothetical protein
VLSLLHFLAEGKVAIGHFPTVWPKNTIFAVYIKKFCKFPILLKNGIRTPTPWGYCGGHCENVCKNFFAKIGFRVKKHNFCENPIGFLLNSPDYIYPENWIPRTTFFTIFVNFLQLYDFCDFSATLRFSQNKYILL